MSPIPTLTAFGETKTLAEWSRKTGIAVRTLQHRLAATDWPAERVLTTPKFTRMLTKERDGVRAEQLVDPVTPWEEDDRCWYVTECHPDGLTLEQVGDLIGVTRERVRQIESIAFDKLKEDPESFQVLLRLLRESEAADAERGDRGREMWERTAHEVHAPHPTWRQQEEAEMARTITHDGETMTVAEWAERLGLSWQTLAARKRYGWTDEEAVTHAADERPERFAHRNRGRANARTKKGVNGAPPDTSVIEDDVTITVDAGSATGDFSDAFEDPPEPKFPLALRVERERIAHQFPLRPDFVVAVELPADLTREEAERMSRWLGAMSFRHGVDPC